MINSAEWRLRRRPKAQHSGAQETWCTVLVHFENSGLWCTVLVHFENSGAVFWCTLNNSGAVVQCFGAHWRARVQCFAAL